MAKPLINLRILSFATEIGIGEVYCSPYNTPYHIKDDDGKIWVLNPL